MLRALRANLIKGWFNEFILANGFQTTHRFQCDLRCVALVVGTLLNLINQGQQFLTGSEISWGHVLLNFLVPYCVANYSATKNEMQRSELNARKNKK